MRSTGTPRPGDRARPRVLLIITGGTLTMVNEGVCDSLKSESVASSLQMMLELQDASLPDFDILEWEDLLDSSDITFEDWEVMSRQIQEHYSDYEGFVVVHGTDSMAYTSSALSFMLENLGKPVVITGAMLPVRHLRTDALRNLTVAMTIAGYSDICEVVILFGSRLIRGNRARKLDCAAMDAFDSPNFPHLGNVGVDITVEESLLLPQCKRAFRVFSNLCRNVIVLKLTAGLPPDLLLQIFSSPVRPLGVILELYGQGTAPCRMPSFLSAIKKGIESGVEIAAVTQCPKGSCNLLAYENGALLHQLGVIECKDMTPESASTKLSYLLGRGFAGPTLRHMMESNLRGEVTESQRKVTCNPPSTARFSPHEVRELNTRRSAIILDASSSHNGSPAQAGGERAMASRQDGGPVKKVPLLPLVTNGASSQEFPTATTTTTTMTMTKITPTAEESGKSAARTSTATKAAPPPQVDSGNDEELVDDVQTRKALKQVDRQLAEKPVGSILSSSSSSAAATSSKHPAPQTAGAALAASAGETSAQTAAAAPGGAVGSKSSKTGGSKRSRARGTDTTDAAAAADPTSARGSRSASVKDGANMNECSTTATNHQQQPRSSSSVIPSSKSATAATPRLPPTASVAASLEGKAFSARFFRAGSSGGSVRKLSQLNENDISTSTSAVAAVEPIAPPTAAPV